MSSATSRAGTSGLLRASSLAVIVMLTLATSSTAAGVTQSSAFCQEARTFFAHGTNLLSLPPKTIRADDAVFKAEQPKMLAAAPSSIKPDLKAVFTFDNGLFTDLSKVGWTLANLPKPVLQSLAISGPKLKPPSDKLIGYLDSTCGLKLARP